MSLPGEATSTRIRLERLDQLVPGFAGACLVAAAAFAAKQLPYLSIIDPIVGLL